MKRSQEFKYKSKKEKLKQRNEGDKIRIDTEKGNYQERIKE